MQISDPIADMLTRVRNALAAGHSRVSVPSSKIKISIAEIMKQEGFIEDYDVTRDEPQPFIRIKLKYTGVRREKRPVISGLERVSRPGRRVYAGKSDPIWVLGGMGVAILSTSQGVMTGNLARQKGVGVEILCRIW